MANEGNLGVGEGRLKTTVPESFPDAGTCRVQKAEVEGTYECLSLWGSFCPHSIFVEFAQPIRFCNHCTKREIFLRTG